MAHLFIFCDIAMTAFFSGLMITAGLIIAIGAQNAFVLKQGLIKHNITAIVLTCWLCGVLLISAGVFGIGALLSGRPVAAALLSLAGGLFLLAYAALSARRAWKGGGQMQAAGGNEAGMGTLKAIGITLALTLLNPHVYVDAVMLIGGSAASLPVQQKMWFTAGAVLASALWFALIGFGTRLLLPLFRRERVWQLLDGGIALMMLYLAAGLLRQAQQVLLV